MGTINCLALMASGKPEYMPRVRQVAHTIAPADLKLELRDGMVTWEWGYRNVFLCEYWPAHRRRSGAARHRQYTIALAKGQSMFGTFGHGVSRRRPPTASCTDRSRPTAQ